MQIKTEVQNKPAAALILTLHLVPSLQTGAGTSQCIGTASYTSHIIQRAFGVHDFITVVPSRSSQRFINEEVSIISTATAPSLCLCAWHININLNGCLQSKCDAASCALPLIKAKSCCIRWTGHSIRDFNWAALRVYIFCLQDRQKACSIHLVGMAGRRHPMLVLNECMTARSASATKNMALQASLVDQALILSNPSDKGDALRSLRFSDSTGTSLWWRTCTGTQLPYYSQTHAHLHHERLGDAGGIICAECCGHCPGSVWCIMASLHAQA